MNFNRLNKVAAAISLVLASNTAMAVSFDIDAPKVLTYASELPVASGIQSGALCDQTVIGKVGRKLPFATTLLATRYIRFDLSGGAKFGAGITTGSFTLDGLTINTDYTVDLVSGGTGASFAIFAVSNESNTTDIPATQTFIFTNTAITPVDADTPVQLSYTVHTNDVSAANGLAGDAIEYPKTNLNYINFGTGLLFSVNPSTLTANVETGFETFKNGASSGSLGIVNLAASDTVCSQAGGTLALTDLLDAATTMTFEGDLNLIQDVDANGEGLGTFGDTVTAAGTGTIVISDSTCSPTATGAIVATAIDNDSATLSGVTGGFLDKRICVVRPATSKVKIVADDSYALALNPAPGSAAAATITVPTGDIVRDGTVLDAPYFTLTPGYISRFMISHLNPTGNAANFTIELQSDAGNAITPNTAGPLPYDATEGTFSGTLAAGTMMQINATDLVTGFGTKQRGSAKFTFVASNNDIQGIYQIVNLTTGEISNIPLPREGGRDGQ